MWPALPDLTLRLCSMLVDGRTTFSLKVVSRAFHNDLFDPLTVIFYAVARVSSDTLPHECLPALAKRLQHHGGTVLGNEHICAMIFTAAFPVMCSTRRKRQEVAVAFFALQLNSGNICHFESSLRSWLGRPQLTPGALSAAEKSSRMLDEIMPGNLHVLDQFAHAAVSVAMDCLRRRCGHRRERGAIIAYQIRHLVQMQHAATVLRTDALRQLDGLDALAYATWMRQLDSVTYNGTDDIQSDILSSVSRVEMYAALAVADHEAGAFLEERNSLFIALRNAAGSFSGP